MANKYFYTYIHESNGARNNSLIPEKIALSYWNSLIFDVNHRTIWHQGMPFGNVYPGTLSYGETFNDIDNNVAQGAYAHAEGMQTYAGFSANAMQGYDDLGAWNDAHAIARGGMHAEGYKSTAYGLASHAEGSTTTANGDASHAEGYNTTAQGVGSHAEGIESGASGDASHAEGQATTAAGVASHAEGHNAVANRDYAHAEGDRTIADGYSSHAEGTSSQASANAAHAEGSSKARAVRSHAEGTSVVDTGSDNAHAEGIGNVGSNSGNAHAEGSGIVGNNAIEAHAEGQRSNATNTAAHAEGSGTTASGISSHAEGQGSTATGNAAHAEGNSTTAQGVASHAEGNNTVAAGSASHTEGIDTRIDYLSQYSHAEGQNTYIAISGSSHAEGKHAYIFNSEAAHAEGFRSSIFSADYSHVEGYANVSYGEASHVQGSNNVAIGRSSFITGTNNVTRGTNTSVLSGTGNTISLYVTNSAVNGEGNSLSNYKTNGTNITVSSQFASGYGLITSNNQETAFGAFNKSYATGLGQDNFNGGKNSYETLFSIGIGQQPNASTITRENALDVRKNGISVFYKHAFGYDEGDPNNQAAFPFGLYPFATRQYVDRHNVGLRNWEGSGTAPNYTYKYINAEYFNDYTNNHANADYSHAEGQYTTTYGVASHAEGIGNITYNPGEHASGKYSYSTKNETIFTVGGGVGPGLERNLLEVKYANQDNGIAFVDGLPIVTATSPRLLDRSTYIWTGNYEEYVKEGGDNADQYDIHTLYFVEDGDSATRSDILTKDNLQQIVSTMSSDLDEKMIGVVKSAATLANTSNPILKQIASSCSMSVTYSYIWTGTNDEYESLMTYLKTNLFNNPPTNPNDPNYVAYDIARTMQYIIHM